MASLKAQFDALKQQHEFTVMQLTDLKEDYQKIKKLNTTILENMMKQSPDALNQIRLIIDGNFYNQKIIDLSAELDQLRNNMNDQIQKRVQQYLKNIKTPQHDCQNCQKCIKLLSECPNCKKYMEKIKKLQMILQQKNEGIDRLRLQIQETKSQYQILQSRKNNQKSQKASQLQQINKILKSNVKDLQEMIKQNQNKYRKFNQQWENQYNNLNQQYQAALDQLQQYKRYLQQQEQQSRQNLQSSKKNHMMKQIQNILGQLGGNRKSTANNGVNTNPRMLKHNSSSSRVIQDTDLYNFSIKDAINRPNQFTYY